VSRVRILPAPPIRTSIHDVAAGRYLRPMREVSLLGPRGHVFRAESPDASRADARLARPFDGGSRRRAPARPHSFDPHVRDALPDLGRPSGSRARRPVGTTGSTGPARAPPPRHPARPRMHRGRGPAPRGPAPDRRDRLRGRRAAAILPGAAPGPGAGCGMTGPPSSSGLGFRPFKAATRVRIPLGAHNRIAHAPVEESGRPHRPVKAEIAGSKPVGRAEVGAGRRAGVRLWRPGSSVGRARG
jgi:hypothetical protein